MREYVTYQAILEEGRQEGRAERGKEDRANGVRIMLIRVGSHRLGIPSAQTLEALQKVASSEKLIELGDRLLEAKTWDDLIMDS